MAKKKQDTKGLAGIVNKVPREIDINGQLHMLAWITPKEGRTLKDLGGAGVLGPMGIPAYYDEGDDYSPSVGEASDGDTGANKGTTAGDDTGGWSGGGNDGNAQENLDSQIAHANSIRAAQQNLRDSLARERAQTPPNKRMVNSFANPFANSGLTPQDRDFNTVPNAQRVAQSYMKSLGADGKSIFAPSVFSSQRIGGDFFGGLKKGSLSTMLGVPSYSSFFAPNTPERKAFAEMALQQMKDDNRLENAANIPGVVGAMVGGYNVKSMMEDLENGGRPALDANGVVQGVFSEGLFGEVYQGNPIDGLEETGWTPDDHQGDGNSKKESAIKSVIEEIKPIVTSTDAYYGRGVGTGTLDMADPANIAKYLLQVGGQGVGGQTPSPIGATYDPIKKTYTMPDGTVIDAVTGRKKKLSGLEIFQAT